MATDPSPSPTASGGPSQQASASPDAVVTPSPAASADPLAALPVIEDDPASLDYYTTEDPGDLSNNDPTLIGRYLDGVRIDAREAGIKIARIGPDAESSAESMTIRQPSHPSKSSCHGTVHSFRFDDSAYQPMLYQPLFFNATPATAFRLVIASYGSMNDPVPTSLPHFRAAPGNDRVRRDEHRGRCEQRRTGGEQPGKVPPRGVYRVVLVCLGEGTARWRSASWANTISAPPTKSTAMAPRWSSRRRGGIQHADGARVDHDRASQLLADRRDRHVWCAAASSPHQLITGADADMEEADVAGLARCERTARAQIPPPRSGQLAMTLPWTACRSVQISPLPHAMTVRSTRHGSPRTARTCSEQPLRGRSARRRTSPTGRDGIIVSSADLETGESVVRVTGSGGSEGRQHSIATTTSP